MSTDYVMRTLADNIIKEAELKEKVNGISDEDLVNKPDHYTVGGHEAIEVIKAKLTPEEFRGYCKGNVLKYVMRSNYKGHHDLDARKAEYYLREMIDAAQTKPIPEKPF